MKILGLCAALLLLPVQGPAIDEVNTVDVANQVVAAWTAWVQGPNPLPTAATIDAGALHRWQEVRRNFATLDRRMRQLGW